MTKETRLSFAVRLRDTFNSSPLLNRASSAAALGKSYSTLCREVNNTDLRAKFGFIDAVRLMQATGDLSLLHLMANELGMTVVPSTSAAVICSSETPPSA